MSSKPKSAIAETPNKKASPTTPSRITRLSKGITKSDSPSPLQNSRNSIERSPRLVNSKPTSDGTRPSTKTSVDRRSPKLSTPPEQTRSLKGSDLQAQLNHLQEDLIKVKEQLALGEKEKEDAINELKEAQKLAEDANEKLNEALLAQKGAEEDSEIEKFRALELEQVEVNVTLKKREDWEKEIEDVRNQHALDVSALLSTTQELEKLKQELAMTCDAKNKALIHADDVTKIAEIHAEKAETLVAEIAQLKALLNSKVESEANENNKVISELNLKIESLKLELEREKIFEEKLMDREASIEQLNVKIEASKMTQAYAINLVEEWKLRVEELENQVKEANRLELSASESLNSVKKQLEGTGGSLQESESKIAVLKEKIGLLEMSLQSQRGDLDESERRLDIAEGEANQMAKMVECLKTELDSVKEEKVQALNNEKLAASSVQTLLEEKNKLIGELESSKDEEEKSKKAMESLVTELHEVSLKARETKEKYLSVRAEHESYETQIEDLKCDLKETNQKYEKLLNDAKHEIDILVNTIDHSKHEFEDSMAEWKHKELDLMNHVNQLKEDKSYLETKKRELVNSLKEAKEEVSIKNEEGAHLRDTLKEAESEVIYLKEVLGEAKSESMILKESLLDKENELQSVIEENEEIQLREAASVKKIEELSRLLEETMANKKNEDNGELSDSEKDYDLLPKVVEFSEENGNGYGREEKIKMEVPPQKHDEPPKHNSHEKNVDPVEDKAIQIGSALFENVNGNKKENHTNENGTKEMETTEKEEAVRESEFKMWESCKIDEKDYSPERETEHESFEEETNSKEEGGESLSQTNGSSERLVNGSISPTTQNQQKKKKPLLHKFGNLLKKKGSSNQK